MNTKEKVKEILEKAKLEGEVFVNTLSPGQLKETGFEPLHNNFWESFESVDIYLQYSCKEGFKLKYRFWSENNFSDYYEEIDQKYLPEVLADYLGE